MNITKTASRTPLTTYTDDYGTWLDFDATMADFSERLGATPTEEERAAAAFIINSRYHSEFRE